MLLTGFEGYGGRSVNPSAEIAKALHGAVIAGVRGEGRTLPVDYAGIGPRIPCWTAHRRAVPATPVGQSDS
jgi:pyroglutamyl-peptidase